MVVAVLRMEACSWEKGREAREAGYSEGPKQGVKASSGLCYERFKTRLSTVGVLPLSCSREGQWVRVVGPLYVWISHLQI